MLNLRKISTDGGLAPKRRDPLATPLWKDSSNYLASIKAGKEINSKRMKHRKKELIQEIEELDNKESNFSLNINDSLRRIVIKSYLNILEFNETQIWAHKAKRPWIKGDECTSFFHKVCTTRQKKGLIKEIEDEKGNKYNINTLIVETIIPHFKGIYIGEIKENLVIDNLEWSPIDSSLYSTLCDPFYELEIKSAIFSFSNDKAPSSDGFTMEF
ncbi:LINE-1 retrotransposable element ORF2 protein [Cucumis melo var. makuwa]|uniref:LINE-1 retrotransposable element ORF2 protein n=1 Tax=Cucumis melo var. makuwa TaxID=1194695 RepID=A0A5D3CTU7_CUCMM|nr:LINE-1 retrotransposable element ORF2 protein [Cucumis melo var. makuwa]TYK15367.1 LINE-1 retrotransposable element ORF2 protein [Cucumis melo var. makuwa]